MRRVRDYALAVVCLLSLAFCLPANAQSYVLDWQTIDGGGGTSVGGGYAVTGTIGQPDAGAMSGGRFAMEGGFWGRTAAIQTPGAPVLTITPNADTGTMTVSWPLPADGWVLEASPAAIGPTMAWTELPASTYQSNFTDNYVTVPGAMRSSFYRLRKP